MSDGTEDNPFDPERMAERRADKLSRAIEQARLKRVAKAAGAQPQDDQSSGEDALSGPVIRKPKLPPPPPLDPEDWRALGLSPAALGKPAAGPSDPPPTSSPTDDIHEPLVLGTGDTKVLGPADGVVGTDGEPDQGAFPSPDDQTPVSDQWSRPADPGVPETWDATPSSLEPPLRPAPAMRLPEDEGQAEWTSVPEPVPTPEPVLDALDPQPPAQMWSDNGTQSAPDPVETPPVTPRGLFRAAPVAPEPVLSDVEPAPHSYQPEPAPRPPALLQLSGVHTDIGRYRVLQGVDLEVPAGQVTMLLGRNGVGKTTTLRTIMGLWRAREGDIWMEGRNLAAMQPAAIARSGIGYVPEDMGVFGDLTVEENMRLGALTGRPNRTRLEWLLGAFPALKTFWTRPAATLSGGQKQMLSIARTMVEPRRLYLIDEPTKGLAPAIVATLAGALRELKHEGATILMVEQNFAVAKALGDTCAVMDDGKVTWNGSMAELAGDAELQARLMGLHLEPGH